MEISAFRLAAEGSAGVDSQEKLPAVALVGEPAVLQNPKRGRRTDGAGAAVSLRRGYFRQSPAPQYGGSAGPSYPHMPVRGEL